MKKQLNPEYTKDLERRCPYCGAYEPQLIEDEDLEDGTWAFSYECKECRGEFDEIYTKIWVYDNYFASSNKVIRVQDPIL